MKSKLIQEAGFSSTYEIDRLEKLIDLTILEVFNIMSNSMNTNKCVYTTYDSGVVACAVEQLINEISKEFNIKKPQDVKYKSIRDKAL